MVTIDERCIKVLENLLVYCAGSATPDTLREALEEIKLIQSEGK